MRKCLSSFDTYIHSRTSKILNLISFLPKLSLPSYTIVHTNHQNNIGILFQLLPKIQYHINPKEEYNPIINTDEYVKHIISFEELRYIDYSMHMKNKRHLGYVVTQPAAKPTQNPLFAFGQTNGSLPYQILHSLPIEYPYDDSK
jgi:hypothetical protein